MRKLTPLAVALLLATFAMIHPVAGQENKAANSLSAKILFIDYGRPNDLDDLEVTNGLEIGYIRSFGKYVSFALPVKIGVANVEGDINNRNLVSLDGLLRLQYQPTESTFFVPYIFGGVGGVIEDFDDTNIQIPMGAGANIRVGKNSYLNVQGEYRKSNQDLRDNLQLGLGYVYRFGMNDRDKDGVADENDQCPDTPGSREMAGCPDSDSDRIADKDDLCPTVAGLAALNGCPDKDGDGVTDADDGCPDTAGTLNGCPDQDADGIADRDDQCPDIAGTVALNGCPDRDGDGVADRFDQCPDEAGLAANNGCPLADSDGDGVADELDRCPTVAGVKSAQGCPDRDEDGVADDADRCPDTPGEFSGCPDTDGDGLIDADDSCPTQAGPIANKGCPEITEEVKEVLEFAMRAVQFETGKATLRAESNTVLDQIVDIMNQYVDYSLVIAGHTDNVGNEDSNQILSEERAKACYTYLVAKGISPKRVSFEGYGESQPVADNNTPVGRGLNRRVEFNLYIP